jgi:DNA (cytosine-5)-methyltransferase 1
MSVPEVADFLGVSERTGYRYERGESAPRPRELLALRGLLLSGQGRGQQLTGRGANFRFIDLFAGIGGMRRGFESIGGKCVFTSEWDRYAQATYRANFECDHELAGDIREIDAAAIPEHDVLLAGFPCQPFSIAGVSKKNALGRRHGFECETQGTLFFEVERIIDAHRPKAFLLENVKNLLSHDRGRTFAVIKRTLEDKLDYKIHCRIIDGKSFVPQHRERIFIVGFRDKNNFDFETLELPDPINGPRLDTILHPENGTEAEDMPYVDNKGQVNQKYILTDHLWKYLQDYAKKHKAKGNGFGYGLVTPDATARTLSARYYKDGSEILVDRGGKRNPRRLTPRECARLMGFEVTNGAHFSIPVSDTQAYKQFGNSVVVPAVKAVATHMAPWIETSLSALADIGRRKAS